MKQKCSCALYRRKLEKPSTFAWVMVPGKGLPPETKVEYLKAPVGAIRLKITLSGQPTDVVVVRLNGNQAVPIDDELTLDGRAGVLIGGKKPVAVLGKIKKGEQEVAAHNFTP